MLARLKIAKNKFTPLINGKANHVNVTNIIDENKKIKK